MPSAHNKTTTAQNGQTVTGQGGQSGVISSEGFSKLMAQLPMLSQILDAACEELQLVLSEQQKRSLLLYLDKLLLWNKAYNLTAITDPKEAMVKHLLDCLAIVPHLPAGDMLDIGTGAGLPGVVVAICQPERHCSVLDSNQKKIRFIRQAVSELALTNVSPFAERIEAHEGQYAVVTSRAFASLEDFVAVAAPRLAPAGRLCAMKGKAPTDEEMTALSRQWAMACQPLHVPNLSDTRHLIELSLKNV